MTEKDVQKRIVHAVDTCFSKLQGNPHLAQHVRNSATLNKHMPKRISLKVVLTTLMVLLALGGIALAMNESLTASLFGAFFGDTQKQELLEGDIALIQQSKQVGEVVYTIEDAIYKSEGDFQGLYGSIRISPAKGSNVVLICDEYSVNDPAGYKLYMGPEDIPEDAKTYADLAKENNAKILYARAATDTISVDGKICEGSYGEFWLPQLDGTLLGTFELTDNVPRATSYDLVLDIFNWEVTLENEHLREGENSTWQKDRWHIMVEPEMQESAKEAIVNVKDA